MRLLIVAMVAVTGCRSDSGPAPSRSSAVAVDAAPVDLQTIRRAEARAGNRTMPIDPRWLDPTWTGDGDGGATLQRSRSGVIRIVLRRDQTETDQLEGAITLTLD